MHARAIVVAGVLATVGTARADRMAVVLDKPAFTATPAELLEAAKLAPAGDAAVVVLRVDEDDSFDDRGRLAARWRVVFVVRAHAGVTSWATLSHHWAPQYQDRPTIRARTVAPDGTSVELDPATITDTPVQANNLGTTDEHSLRAPLPRLQVGAVVEQEVVVNDREPRFDGGAVHSIWLGYEDAPVASTRISVSAPVARKLTHRARVLPASVTPVRSVAGGRERWTYAIGSLAPQGLREPGTPSDVQVGSSIATATGASWKAVAAAYRAVVERRITEGPIALPAGVARTVEAITAWTHAKVQTTGFPLDELVHVPATPDATLRRGAGSSLDKATLLVALLRQAGMRADVALIDEGPGLDVDRELPGLGPFDRALVRVRGGAGDVWIDPGAELAAPGVLPPNDRGRRALVIADDTADLVTTPASTPADHTIRGVRTFELVEFGRAVRVTEVDRYTGWLEQDQRAWLRDTRPDDVRKRLESYARNQYGGTLERTANTPLADVATRLEHTLVVARPDVVAATHYRLEAWLYPSVVMGWLPSAVEADAGDARRHDYVWSVPQTIEIENRIPVPDGFTLTLPADEVRPLGTASLSTKFRLDARTAVVTMRLETGKVRITPAELATLRRELAAARKLDVHLVFDQTGMALAEQGKFRDAVVELERLIALHPKEPLHHRQLALGLLRAGMGEAARRAARRALTLEPASAETYFILGWLLEHDTLGRRHRPDVDRAGALAAYAKARKLDPKLQDATRRHAELLQTGVNGVEFDRGCDLAAAAEAWRAVLALEDDADAADNLADVLIRAGDGAGAAKVLAARAAADRRDLLFVAATALASGGAAAVKVVDGMRSGAVDRTKLLNEGASYLLRARHYPQARELFTTSGKLAAEPGFAGLVSRIVRKDPSPPGDVSALAVELQVVLYDHTHPFTAFVDRTAEQDARAVALAGQKALRATVGRVTSDLSRDVTVASVEPRMTTIGALSRVELKPAPGIPSTAHAFVTYFSREGGAQKVIGLALTTEPIARHVQRLLARKDEAGAMQLLDWLAADLPAALPAAQRLAAVWGGKSPRDRDAVPLAAAMLLEDDAGMVPVLERCAGRSGSAREACDRQLATVLGRANRARELEVHTAAWASRAADPDSVSLIRGEALTALGRGHEAEALADAILAKKPDLLEAHALRSRVSAFAGALPEAIQRLDPMVAKPERVALNDAAWLRLAAETDLPKALELAKRAVGRDKAKAPPAMLDTLAAIQAELGDLAGAKDTLWPAMEGREMLYGDWYILGRMAEHIGLRDDAIAAYRRVVVPARVTRIASISAQTFAQRRLARLGAK